MKIFKISLSIFALISWLLIVGLIQKSITIPTLLGATKIAWLAIEGLREQKIGLVKYLNPNY